MARRRAGAAAAALLLVCGALSTVIGEPVAAQDDPPSPPSPPSPVAAPDLPDRQPPAHPALQPALLDDLHAGAPVGAATDAGDTPGAPAGESVTVVVEAESTDAAVAAVEAVGGAVTVILDGVLQADVPAASLGRLADGAGVEHVREPLVPVPDVLSEGVSTTGASAWLTASLRGAGSVVVVLDLGFGGYASRLGTELPATVATDLGRCSDPNGTAHGTAVAEIVHDMAPQASLRLVCIDTDVEFVAALQTFAALGVDVVNGSFGFTGSGRGDGSGGANTIAGAVAALRAQNILYVASAGNFNTTHRHVPAVGDGDLLGFVDFVDLAPSSDFLPIAVAAHATVSVVVQWDGWPQPAQDLDLYVEDDIFDVGTCNNQLGVMNDFVDTAQGPVLVEGENPQPPGPPVEQVTFTNCHGFASWYWVYVNRYAGAGAPRLDVFVSGDAFVPDHTGSSIAEPGSSPAVLSVGAHCWANGAVRDYSSQGPTVDGRVLPDLSAPDGTSDTVYGASGGCQGGFTGTSASAPHAAGAAALLFGANPGLDVAELEQLLIDRAADAGPTGADNAFGAGWMTLGPAGSASPPTPRPFAGVPPVRLYDTRAGATGLSESPVRSTPVGTGQFLSVRVAGVAGVPADAEAVVLNVTATNPTSTAFLTVQPRTNAPTTSNINVVAGQTVAQQVTATVGPGGTVQVFNSSGTTDVIVDLSGWYGPTGPGGAPATNRFTALAAPRRAFDSRAGAVGYAEPVDRTAPLSNNQTVDLDLDLAGGGVPVGATAVVLNLTVTGPTSPGWVVTSPTGGSVPVTSSLNFTVGQTVANLVVAPVQAGTGRLRVQMAAISAHVIADVVGWFQPGVGAGYVPLDPPARQVDSRTGTGPRLGPLVGNSAHAQTVGRYHGVPIDAEAVVLGVIAVAPTAVGWFTVFPTGQALPATSSLNFAPGSIVPNAVVAGLGTGGRVSYQNSGGATHLVSDVAGYFIDP